MKKSIAFLGALLFGSVTFAQVSKNDTINKPSSRKVSAEDMKKFPVEEVNSETGDIKGEARFKDHKDSGLLKISADNASSDPNATITQKGKGNEAMMTEKHHYTIKLTNANKKAAEGGTGQIVNDESATTTQKKHVANIKWTPGMAAKDSTTTPTPTKMTTTSKEASTTEVHEYLKRTK